MCDGFKLLISKRAYHFTLSLSYTNKMNRPPTMEMLSFQTSHTSGIFYGIPELQASCHVKQEKKPNIASFLPVDQALYFLFQE